MRTAMLFCLVLLFPGILRAQGTVGPIGAAVAPGTTVRVSAPAVWSEVVTGKVAAAGPDALVLEPGSRDGDYRSVAFAEIESLEVYRGNAGAKVGGIIGGAIGAGAAYLIASSLAKESECTEGLRCLDNLGEEMVGGALLAVGSIVGGTLVGWALGTAIGHAIGPDIWEPVPTDRLRVGIAPHLAGGIGIGISVAF